MKVAAVGFSCMDVYENLNRSYPTGNGVDFVINLSKLGVSTSVISAVGNDGYGKEMVEKLNQYGVDTSHIQVNKGSTAVIKMSLINNDRVHGEETDGVMANYALCEEDFEFIKGHDFIHTDLFGRVYCLLPEFKKAGCQIVFDFSIYLEDKDVDRILPYIDYGFFSYKEHDEYIENFLKRAKEFGPKVVTATLGDKGSLSYDGGRFYEYGVIPTNVVNTVGAGDSYIAGFMYGVMSNKDIEGCMKTGTEMASRTIQNFEPY